MSTIDRQVSRARRRLTSNVLLDRAALGVVIAAGTWALALLIERIFALDLWLLPGLGIAAGLAGVIALVGTYLARISALRAAVAIDAAAGLKERLSTALTCRRDADPFAQATVHDAEKTAARVHVPSHLRLCSPALWPWSLGTVLVAVILYAFLPVFDILAQDEQAGSEREQATAIEREQVTVTLNEQQERLKELAERNPELKDLAQNLESLSLPDEPTATPEDIRREAVKRLDNVAQKLSQEKESRQLDALKRINRMLSQLDKPSGDDPASQLSKALAQGDMQRAQQALSELKKKLQEAAKSGDPQAKQQLAEIQKQLDNLAKQLAKLGDTTQLEKELQRKAGLSEEDAKKLLKQLAKLDPKQMQKELQRRLADSGLTPEQIQQLAKKLADQKAAMKKVQGLGKCLANAAAAMQQSDSPDGAAAAANAMAALDGAMGQLSDLEMAQQLLNEIELELAELASRRDGI